MFDDFKELLSIFNAQKVKYPIVGGYAVSYCRVGPRTQPKRVCRRTARASPESLDIADVPSGQSDSGGKWGFMTLTRDRRLEPRLLKG
jgi:hypothetical protein